MANQVKSWPWGKELPIDRLARIEERERQLEARVQSLKQVMTRELEIVRKRSEIIKRQREQISPYLSEKAAHLVRVNTRIDASVDEIELLLMQLDDFLQEPRT